MGRATYGAARHRKKVRLFGKTKGFRGPRGNHYRLAKEALVRAGTSAYRDRRRRRREFRSLWVTRLSAACDARGMAYSRFINGCKKANIALNRKMLSELAIHDAAAFDAVFAQARSAVGKAAAAA